MENIKKEEKEESKPKESKPKESKPEESKTDKEPDNNDSIEGGGVKRIKLAQRYDFF